jgi:hypothetical protein
VNRAQLFAAFRLRVDDNVAPYLWGDPELQEFLDDAHNEAAERALLLRDSTTAAICQVAITAGTHSYTLDPRILKVRRAKLDGERKPLRLATVEGLDRDWPGWDEEEDADTPKVLAIDPEGAGWRSRLVRTPAADGVLRLEVCRLPLTSISTDAATPEIPERQHVKLLDWMEHRAYSKKDADTFDAEKAAKGEAAFTAVFGEKVTARTALLEDHDMLFPVVRPIGL